MAGLTDLDLLVARGDKDHAIKLRAGHGFKHWPDVAWRDHPAVMSFLGYDETRDFIHHVHVRLVIGHSLLKNFRIPCEDRFLVRNIRYFPSKFSIWKTRPACCFFDPMSNCPGSIRLPGTKEKRHKIIGARRAASRRLIVLTDRYPQNQIGGFNDGPLLPRLTSVPAWLRRLEASVYALADRTPPDLVIKVHTSPEAV